MFLADFSLRSKCFRGRDEKQRITAVSFFGSRFIFRAGKTLKIPCLGLSFLANPTETLATQAKPTVFIVTHCEPIYPGVSAT